MGLKNEKGLNISAKKTVKPIFFILIGLFFLVLYLMIRIAFLSSGITKTLEEHQSHIENVYQIRDNTIELNDNVKSFVITLEEKYLINYGKLTHSRENLETFINEFDNPDHSKQTIANVRQISVEHAELIGVQAHAIALIKQSVEMGNSEYYQYLPQYQLSEQELALSNQERIDMAVELLYSDEYNSEYDDVFNWTGSVINSLKEDYHNIEKYNLKYIYLFRLFLVVFVVSEMLIAIIVMYISFKHIILPMSHYTESVSTDKPFNEKQGVKEIRLLAHAYNDQFEKRKDLEKDLRNAAEQDFLTKLPNRYSYSNYVNNLKERKIPISVFLFDVNNLKVTNDTKGHQAGDALIKVASECIFEVFNDGTGNNCFRFGGDEFAAILELDDKDKIAQLVDRFGNIQKERNVSVAFGYSTTSDISLTTFEKLFALADKSMYERKNSMKK